MRYLFIDTVILYILIVMAYLDERFTRHVNKSDVNIIFEVGSRYGDESLELKQIFPSAKIYSFECNPLTIGICKETLHGQHDIYFNDFGLGDKNESLPFYSFLDGNDGASSLLKRIDYEETQKETGIITIKKMVDFVKENNITTVDLLCIDVQGYELNVLKGCEEFIKNINYIIMEEPKKIINTDYLPENVYSKYINAPSSEEIHEFMVQHNFEEIERFGENHIEDNVMYKGGRSPP